ncbi:glycosyltransferase family 9 protein [Vibrio litoralis]|uniref:glycosyltransferase family 9 protein n=1 Tax=Vibrio litoralis TaxID=335972 RepID=UPI001865A602|nr:glycosyltransferase family 9 protein [Vibrio litoralis]
MLKTLKTQNRALRNKIKAWKLARTSQKYDKDPLSGSSPKIADVRSLAILRWDNKLGDAIMCGVFIQALQQYRPDIKVTVISPDFCANWLKKATHCDIILCGKRSQKTAIEFRQYRGQFDAVIELGSSFDFKELTALYQLGAPINIGYEKFSHPIFNINIDSSAVHFKDRYLAVAKLFIPNTSLKNIEIPIIPFNESATLPTLSNNKNIAINLFGSSKYRQFSEVEAIKLLTRWLTEFPVDHLYLMPVPDKVSLLKHIVKKINNDRVSLISETPSLELTLKLLSKVDLCFTPDTSVVHMASALNTPTLAIYADDPTNLKEWHPLSSRYEVLLNPKAKDNNDRIYVYDFKWQDLKEKRLKLLQE